MTTDGGLGGLSKGKMNQFQTAGTDSTADLESDPKIIASIYRANHKAHFESVEASGPWDVLIVDECHHLSDWDPGGL